MPALTIDLNDNATDGLDQIMSKLEDTAVSAGVAAKGNDVLTASGERQLIVIKQQNSALTELGKSGVSALGQVGAAGARAFGVIALEAEKAAIATGLVLQARRTAESLAAAAAEKAAWWGVEQAAEAAGGAIVKTILGIGPEVAAATAAIKGLEFVLARTGKTMEATGFKALSSQTMEQAAAFKKLTDEAERHGMTIDRYSASRKDSLSDFKKLYGVEVTSEYTSNLDRMKAASAGLSSSVARDFGEMSTAFREYMKQPMEWPDLGIGRAIDSMVTPRAETAIENLRHISKAYDEVTKSIRVQADMIAAQDPSDKRAAAKRFEIDLMREQQVEMKKLDSFFAKNAEGTKLLKEANEKLADRVKDRAETERVAAIKTMSGIDAEIASVKRKSVEKQAAGKFDVDDAKAYTATMITLSSRREAIEKEIHAAGEKRRKDRATIYTAEMKETDAQIKRVRELLEVETKRTQQLAQMSRAFAGDMRDKGIENQLSAAKEMLAAEKEMTAEKMKAGGAKDSAVKTKLAEMDKEFATSEHRLKMQQIETENREKMKVLIAQKREAEKLGGTVHDMAVAEQKRLMEVDKLQFETKKKRLDELAKFQREINQMDFNETRQKEMAKFQLVKERHDKEKALMQGAFEKAFDPKAIAANADPRKVVGAIQDERAKKAIKDQSERDRALYERGQAGNEAAAKRYADNQRAAEKRARTSVNRDLNNGTLGEGEIVKGQAQVAAQTIATLNQQGRLNNEQAKFAGEQLKTMADQQRAVEIIGLGFERLSAIQRGQKETAKKQLSSAQSQAGAMGI